jgi:hypothetical protein
MNAIKFNEATERDLATILDLFKYHIVNTTVLFDTCILSISDFQKRIFIIHLKYIAFLVVLVIVFIGH